MMRILNRTFLTELFKRYDFSFFGAACAIFIIGILNLYSATHSNNDVSTEGLYRTQFLWFCISMLVGFFISFVKTKTIVRYSYFVYVSGIIFLILVHFLGDKGMGAQRWLALGPLRFQPSEIMKLGLVLALSRWFSKADPMNPLGFKELFVPAIIAGFPALLVIMQPDLGTGLLIFFITFSMCFYRNLQWKVLIILGALGLVVSYVGYNYALHDYQKKRITNFIDPTADAKGSGYNAIQSKIAIGSGQFIGKGFKKSSQASLNYLPENHTDFVFAIFNEEHGFFGSLVLISLYLVLFYRLVWLASSVGKIYDSLVVMGVMFIFFWHTFINMGMVTGLLPIVGIPLPLMSYGGTSLLTFGVGCGIATSISNSRNLF